MIKFYPKSRVPPNLWLMISLLFNVVTLKMSLLEMGQESVKATVPLLPPGDWQFIEASSTGPPLHSCSLLISDTLSYHSASSSGWYSVPFVASLDVLCIWVTTASHQGNMSTEMTFSICLTWGHHQYATPKLTCDTVAMVSDVMFMLSAPCWGSFLWWYHVSISK